MTISYVLDEEDADRINQEFIDNFDYKYWLFKLKTHHQILTDLEEFVDGFGDDFLQKEALDEYRLALQAEVVYDFYHTTEALFSLFIAVRASHIPWLKMKHLRVRQICDFIRDVVLDDGVSDEDIRYAFYRGVDPDALEEDEDFADSVAFIQQYLNTVGNRYLDMGLYDEYKHGLRLITLQKSVNIRPEEKNAEPTIDKSGNTHVYLQSEQVKKEGRDEYHQVVKVSEWFNYDLYYQLCIINCRLIEQMFQSLQQNLHGTDDGETIEITLFEYDLEEIFEGYERRVTEKLKYPVGDKAYELG